MISKNTLSYLSSLKDNNNKPWFEENRDKFHAAQENFRQFVEKLITGIGRFNEDIAVLETRQCVFRQHRDIRFSKDKTPYKHHMGAYLNKGTKKINTPGYYFHLEPGKSLLAAGWYQPEPPVLAKIRQEIDYSADEWLNIINSKEIRKLGFSLDRSDSLQRPPKNFEHDNPLINDLKLKSFVLSKKIPDEQLLNENFLSQAVKAFKSLKPFIDFLYKAND